MHNCTFVLRLLLQKVKVIISLLNEFYFMEIITCCNEINIGMAAL